MISIRPMDAIDYEKVANIYQQGIDSKQCTFETEVPTWESFDQGHLQYPRLVAVDEQGQVCGFITSINRELILNNVHLRQKYQPGRVLIKDIFSIRD